MKLDRTIQIRFPKPVADKLKAIAESKGMTLSTWARTNLMEMIMEAQIQEAETKRRLGGIRKEKK